VFCDKHGICKLKQQEQWHQKKKQES
jgi:hypothetical protein